MKSTDPAPAASEWTDRRTPFLTLRLRLLAGAGIGVGVGILVPLVLSR